MGTGWVGEMKLFDIVVLNNEEGKPYFNLKNEVKKEAESRGDISIHLSISHIKEFATAVVISEKYNN